MAIKYNTVTNEKQSVSRESTISTLLTKKIERIDRLKYVIELIIYVNAPIWKQNNIGLGLYNFSEEAIIKQWVRSAKAIYDQKEIAINDAIDDSELDAININIETLMSAVQTHYDGVVNMPVEITKYAFRCRLSLNERILMDNAHEDTELSLINRQTAFTLTKDFELSESIDLSDPALEQGLLFWYSIGKLQYARIAEIVDTEAVNEIHYVKTVADFSGDLGGKYFTINFVDTNYYVWFDVDSGSIDPNVADRVGVEINISENDTAITIATAIKSVFDQLSGIPFVTSRNDDELTIINTVVGNVGDVNAGDSGFTISTLQQG